MASTASSIYHITLPLFLASQAGCTIVAHCKFTKIMQGVSSSTLSLTVNHLFALSVFRHRPSSATLKIHKKERFAPQIIMNCSEYREDKHCIAEKITQNGWLNQASGDCVCCSVEFGTPLLELSDGILDQCRTPLLELSDGILDQCRTPLLELSDGILDQCRTPLLELSDGILDQCRMPLLELSDGILDQCRTPLLELSDGILDQCRTPLLELSDGILDQCSSSDSIKNGDQKVKACS